MSESPSKLELVEIHPIVLGGDPVDPANKRLLDREGHIRFVRYWNGVIRDLREQQKDQA